jgi:hypothetical protein
VEEGVGEEMARSEVEVEADVEVAEVVIVLLTYADVCEWM